ncbi:hypothetical protein EB796_005346 [Bugula neritina]|uniref:Sulfatase N-terminal domain-containing protein n=1 Tax=Bugula neritina TaxID=10212 RepID=A0A7J7KCG3_BUGNE|nr:hypothetical protein EB796_005346 [Bugula neritina]
MMVSTTAPHTPLQTTEEMYNTHDFLNGSEPESIKRRKYLGLVSAVDDIIGETIQSLKDADLYNNSVIIFTSDNGGTSLPYRFPGLLEAAGNNYPLRSGKGSMLEGGVKVPTLYFDTRLPQKYAGTKRDFLIHISDWLPTMMHLAGNDSFDVSIDGVSQYGNLRGSYSELKKYCARRELLLSLTNYSALSTETLCGASDAAFRFEDWKLLYGTESGVASHSVPTEWVKPAESPELPDITGDSCFRLDEKGNQVLRCLFNLKEDPYEQTNLYDSHPRL